MSTPQRQYRVDVSRDQEGILHALVRRTPESPKHVVCTHITRAMSQKDAEQQALVAHETCEHLGSTQ